MTSRAKGLTKRSSQPPAVPMSCFHMTLILKFAVKLALASCGSAPSRQAYGKLNRGGCLCGGVRYRLHVRPKQGSDCHCEDCRRASVAPYVTWCSVPSKAIEVLSGELRRVSYADRLPSFASCCGTPLFIQDEVRSEWIDVTVASLDDPKTFHPEAAIWTEDKLPWVKLDPSRRAFRRSRDENA
jgi:hypothetical protein